MKRQKFIDPPAVIWDAENPELCKAVLDCLHEAEDRFYPENSNREEMEQLLAQDYT